MRRERKILVILDFMHMTNAKFVIRGRKSLPSQKTKAIALLFLLKFGDNY